MGIENDGVIIMISAAIGGTAEALGGGKFANGAVTGAYVMMLNHMMHGDGLPEPDGVDAISGAAIDKYGPIHEYYGMTKDAFLSLSPDDQQFMIAQAKWYIDKGDKTGMDYREMRIEHEKRLAGIMDGTNRLGFIKTINTAKIEIVLEAVLNRFGSPIFLAPKHSLDNLEQQQMIRERKHQ
jgi:hypothetical protein